MDNDAGLGISTVLPTVNAVATVTFLPNTSSLTTVRYGARRERHQYSLAYVTPRDCGCTPILLCANNLGSSFVAQSSPTFGTPQ